MSFFKAWKFMLAVIWIVSLLGVWSIATAQTVYFNTAGTQPGHVAGITDSLTYGVWSWRERTGIPLIYAGSTAESCVDGQITVRTASAAEWSQLGMPFHNAAAGGCYQPGANTYNGWVIVINPAFPVTRNILLHELGHVLGFWTHSSDPHAVMHSPVPARYTLSTLDVLGVLASPHYAATQPASLCHVEVADDFDLYVPDFHGYRAALEYLGVVSGYHTWGVADSSINPASPGCAGSHYQSDGGIWLADLRGMAASYHHAVLQPAGVGLWRLVGIQ